MGYVGYSLILFIFSLIVNIYFVLLNLLHCNFDLRAFQSKFIKLSGIEEYVKSKIKKYRWFIILIEQSDLEVQIL